jgi:ferredoxin
MLNKALAQKGLALKYCKEIPTVGNYIVMYNYDSARVPQDVAHLSEKATEFGAEILAKQTTKIKPAALPLTAFYAIGNRYFARQAKRMRVTDACVGCGLCENVCPVHCIAMRGGKPEFGHAACAQCMACMQWCPKRAIVCGKSAQRNFYTHPRIKASELCRGGGSSYG